MTGDTSPEAGAQPGARALAGRGAGARSCGNVAGARPESQSNPRKGRRSTAWPASAPSIDGVSLRSTPTESLP